MGCVRGVLGNMGALWAMGLVQLEGLFDIIYYFFDECMVRIEICI